MIQYLVYSTEASICQILFFIIYVLMVKTDTFYRLKRFYLLSSIILSLLIPLLPSTSLTENIEKRILPIENIPKTIPSYHDSFEKVVFSQVQPKSQINISAQPQANYLSIFIVILYAAGVTFLLIRLARNFYHIYALARKNPKESYGKYRLIKISGDYPTFSFLRFIFFNCKNLNDVESSHILSHEEVHIKEHHSIDIILIEIFKVFFWYNPIIWQYKKAIIKVHECQADSYFIDIQSDSFENYQSLLLKQYLSNFNIELAHPFNYSLIKYRIDMMTKTKSKWWAKFKLLFALPVILLMLVAFSKVSTKNLPTESINSKDSVISADSLLSNMVFVPAGMFVLDRKDGEMTKRFEVTIESFWMRQNEVSNAEYFEYLGALKKDSAKKAFENALPNAERAPVKDYFTNTMYSNYPVVGITFTQAKNFCKWKTIIENQKLKAQGKTSVQNYRLPYEVEWIYASFGGIDPDKIMKPVISKLAVIGSNDCNEWGLYNMFDNVSEWTNSRYDPSKYMIQIQNDPASSTDIIIVKGNNYKNTGRKEISFLHGNDSYDYVGFRYVRSYVDESTQKIK